MLSLRDKLTIAAVIAGALTWAGPAAAGTIDITNVQVPLYQAITLSGGTNPVPYGYISIAGEIVLTTSNDGTLDTFCVDLFHDIYLGGSYTYFPVADNTDNSTDAGPPPGPYPLTAEQIAEMTAFADYGAYTLQNGIPAPYAGDPSAWSAAIQAAIWDAEYGTTATGSTDFEIDLAYIDGLWLGGFLDGYNWGYEIGDGSYDQGVYVANGQQLWDTAPEPTTIALFGAGLIGLGALRRRRKTLKDAES